ncbi:phosphopyruvate hydratase [Rhodococcus sp. BP-149]|uniref:phosphopyruvate hydratase n=1 Tax=unclassified Rhodococcus (in: high G+C Gram-positive bacteria) TaxID=192944 RepID=UPI001C9A8229|nr:MULTISPECIES: phosphopyruvate hydratase [unclassified Rhodococcus (in: high G+C Gram-positive bacteria)]MBY6687752.1 phosphopyruvate hydratase [Rhodococcus sp. BP-288]MBY6696017.1 phosphopyruvate hydratase [Rhodococcus sp. BP-188]MBY6700614.1 phosphopyruvate hydratase [Rhodococcus sp. BP-285]MBY6705011.1 phosphopyruvate hydratase [Rhodococcus sp. BP-283]MBY6708575.1 phosphopyruvate hydratase [Rhodococcus sp. BP-241]
MNTISGIHARMILDSRGRPTVEVDVATSGGTVGRAAVPSGASTGTYEAWELRDGGTEWGGLGVDRAVAHVTSEIADAVVGLDVRDQEKLDGLLVELDGSTRLRRLGANAVLAVSLAAARAAATCQRLSLHDWIGMLVGGDRSPTIPLPMVNILSGGLHARGGMDVQDFLVVPVGAGSTRHAISMSVDLRAAAQKALSARGLSTLLADEGGLSPGFATGDDALAFMVEAIERAGLIPGRDVAIAIDVAAHTLWDPTTSSYAFRREGVRRTTAEVIDLVEEWVHSYPIVSVEDALDEEDWEGWTELTARLDHRVNLIGDDLFTTNPVRLQHGIDHGAANGVLVKVNQNGTLTGTLAVLRAAKSAGYVPVVSARSGETEDSFISDLAVGTAAGQIKIGSMRNSDRLSKYNQLLRIDEKGDVPFAGTSALQRWERRMGSRA